MIPRLLYLLLALSLAGLPACSSAEEAGDAIDSVDRGNASAVLDMAESELQAGRPDEALEWLLEVREVTGLVPEDRARGEDLADRCLQDLIAAEPAEGHDADFYEDLFDLSLAPRLRARAGILAAQRMLDEGDRKGTFKMIKKLEDELPTNTERVLAGDLVARAGLDLIRDSGRYLLLFRYRTKGIQALEYLIVTYPLDPHCPEAYSALAETYENTDELDLAIARCEDLMVYHPGSPYTAISAARLPYLRLKRLNRNDYDRGQLLLARQEIARWLTRYAGHELEPWVIEIGKSCESRLADNDLIVARYYVKIEVPFGARLHAERALVTAEAAGLSGKVQEARAILETLPADRSRKDRVVDSPDTRFEDRHIEE